MSAARQDVVIVAFQAIKWMDNNLFDYSVRSGTIRNVVRKSTAFWMLQTMKIILLLIASFGFSFFTFKVTRIEPAISLSPTSTFRTPRNFWRICWSRAGKIAAVLAFDLFGLVGVADGLWGPIWPTAPQIEPTVLHGTEAFSIPFVVTNASVIFGIRDAKFTCWLQEAVFDNKTIFDNGFGIDAGPPVKIKPGTMKRPFFCNAGNKFGGNQLVSGKIKIEIDYTRSLGPWTRKITTHSGPFVWDGAINAWLQGEPMR